MWDGPLIRMNINLIRFLYIGNKREVLQRKCDSNSHTTCGFLQVTTICHSYHDRLSSDQKWDVIKGFCQDYRLKCLCISNLYIILKISLYCWTGFTFSDRNFSAVNNSSGGFAFLFIFNKRIISNIFFFLKKNRINYFDVQFLCISTLLKLDFTKLIKTQKELSKHKQSEYFYSMQVLHSDFIFFSLYNLTTLI